MLGERGATALERAHHVERSARRGDAAAIAVLREAGQAAAGRAPATSARLFGAALRLLGPRAEGRAELLAAQAAAHMGAGQWREAYDAIRESLTLSEAPPVPMIATTAALEHMLGRHQAAHQRLQAALAELPDERSADGVTLMLEIGRDGLYRMRYADMRTWSTRSLEAARPLGDRGLLATAAAGVAIAGAFAGDHRGRARRRGRGRGARRRHARRGVRAGTSSSPATRSPARRCCSTATRSGSGTPSARSPSPRPPARASVCPCCSGPAPCGRWSAGCAKRPRCSTPRSRSRASPATTRA